MANENMIKFLRGSIANLPQTATAGALYFTTDEGVYLGLADGTYHRYGDFIIVANVDALPATGAHETCMYYCVEENILAKYDATEGWVQINKQPTAEEMKTLLGLGTAAYENKGAFDAAGEAKKVADYVGTFTATEGVDTVVKYIDAKTANIASDERVNGIENRVKTIEDDYLKAEDIANFETKENVKKVADDLAGYKTSNDAALAGVKATADAAATKEYTDAELAKKVTKTDYEADKATFATKTELGNVDAKFANYKTAEAQKAIDDEQDRRLGVIEGDYLKAADIANFETKENVKKVADDLAAYVESNDAALDAMYSNDEIDTAVQGAKDYAKGLVDAIPAQTDYSVKITEDTTDSTIAKRYIFTQLGEEIGRIDLAKELVVTSGSVKEVEVADMPYVGATVGDKYIELVIANQTAPIYVPAKDLVDIYTAKDGAAEVQVAISNTNEISATLVNKGITEAKLADEVTTKLNKVWEEVGVAKSLVDAEKDRAEGAYDKKGDAAAAQAAAEATAAAALATARTEISTEIDADVKVVADDLAAYVTSNDAALALKANTADVYAKTETYNKEEVDAAVEAAKTDASNKDAVILAEAQKYTDAAKAEAIADAAGKYETIGTAQGIVDGLKLAETYEPIGAEARAIAAAESKVNALAGNVYTKEEVYTKTEVEALLTWGEF